MLKNKGKRMFLTNKKANPVEGWPSYFCQFLKTLTAFSPWLIENY